VVQLKQALEEARRRGLDLVEVAPQANPVVCRIVNWGKYKYKQEKREKRRQKARKVKEMRFTTQIEEHDFETKLRHIKRFLEQNNKVKVSVFFRGREIVHMDRGRDLLERVAKETAGIAKVDQSPKSKGRSLQMLLIPLERRKNEDAKEKGP
jgi:translation initiation factor IF-3